MLQDSQVTREPSNKRAKELESQVIGEPSTGGPITGEPSNCRAKQPESQVTGEPSN